MVFVQAEKKKRTLGVYTVSNILGFVQGAK
jgi:hypothetical protein